jgi:hypothetical protein
MSEPNSGNSTFSLDKQRIERILLAVDKGGYKDKIIASESELLLPISPLCTPL